MLRNQGGEVRILGADLRPVLAMINHMAVHGVQPARTRSPDFLLNHCVRIMKLGMYKIAAETQLEIQVRYNRTRTMIKSLKS